MDDPLNVTVVLMGVSGGKSTVMGRMVEQLGWASAEADDFHPAANVAKMAGPPTDRRGPLALAAGTCNVDRRAGGGWQERRHHVLGAQRQGTAISFATGTRPSVRTFDVDAEVVERRMKQRRGHYMPPSLLGSQLEILEVFQPDEPGFVVSGELPLDEIVNEVVARLRR